MTRYAPGDSCSRLDFNCFAALQPNTLFRLGIFGGVPHMLIVARDIKTD